MYIWGGGHMPHVHMEVTGYLVGVGNLLLQVGFLVGTQTLRPVPMDHLSDLAI